MLAVNLSAGDAQRLATFRLSLVPTLSHAAINVGNFLLPLKFVLLALLVFSGCPLSTLPSI